MLYPTDAVISDSRESLCGRVGSLFIHIPCFSVPVDNFLWKHGPLRNILWENMQSPIELNLIFSFIAIYFGFCEQINSPGPGKFMITCIVYAIPDIISSNGLFYPKPFSNNDLIFFHLKFHLEIKLYKMTFKVQRNRLSVTGTTRHCGSFDTFCWHLFWTVSFLNMSFQHVI